MKLLLQLFRTGTEVLDIPAAALGADIRHRLLYIAMVAG